MKPQLETKRTLISKVMNQEDDSAWEEFIDYYKDYLIRVLKRYDLPHQDCLDISQNTMLKVWELLPNFDYNKEKGRFRSWLAQVAINKMKEHLRRNTRLKRAIKAGKFEPETNGQDPEVEKIFQKEWQVFIANKAWDIVSKELSESVLKSFQLFIEGKGDLEIAEELQITHSSVRVYRQRVRHKLSQEILRLEEELG